MKMHSGLQGVLGLCCLALSVGAWAQGEDEAQEGSEEAAAEESADDGDEGGAGGSSANEGDRRLYFSPMFSYTMADGDRTTDDAMGGVVSLGRKMTSGLNLEVTGFLETMGREDETLTDKSAELSGVGVAAMIFPSTTVPLLYGVVAVHQGQAKGHPTTPDTIGFSYKSTVFDVGVGYLFSLNEWLGGFEAGLRAELRYRMDSHHRRAAGDGGKDEFYEGVANVGLLIPLGQAAAAAAPVEEATPAGDADGDGVPDDADQCPDTPAGAAVNETGCEGDADGDGVVDRLDACPDTPAGTTVDEKGCPPVVESGCRAPGPGEAINLEGCATGEAVVLKGVTFEVNSSRLTANAKVILNQVADSLAAAPHMRVEIGGHTDAQGSDAFNQKLSDRRALAVKDYLIARGIDPARLTSKGYGESQPVDSNETAEGRELNRRVEMKVLEGGTQ